jgi:hypothetical protein
MNELVNHQSVGDDLQDLMRGVTKDEVEKLASDVEAGNGPWASTPPWSRKLFAEVMRSYPRGQSADTAGKELPPPGAEPRAEDARPARRKGKK